MTTYYLIIPDYPLFNKKCLEHIKLIEEVANNIHQEEYKYINFSTKHSTLKNTFVVKDCPWRFEVVWHSIYNLFNTKYPLLSNKFELCNVFDSKEYLIKK